MQLLQGKQKHEEALQTENHLFFQTFLLPIHHSCTEHRLQHEIRATPT